MISRYKSAIAWPNGKAFAFEKEAAPGVPGTNYVRYDFVSGNIDQAPQSIIPAWPGLRSTRPDAAVYWGGQKAYFFYGDEYVRYDARLDAVDQDYLPPNPPKKIAGNWNMPWTSGIDAAVNWGNGKLYFFRAHEYLRYDMTLDRMDSGFPRNIAGSWPGVFTDRVDAVLYQGGTKAYFFRDDDFRRYDVKSDAVDAQGQISSLGLDAVPEGMWTAGRDLTPGQAHSVVAYLIEGGSLSLRDPLSPPGARVVIKPAVINGVSFENDLGPAPIIDNVDQKMVVVLHRITRWLNGGAPSVTKVRHKGIGHGSGPSNDCHNQGRALDFSGVDGTSQGLAFDRKVLRDWGSRPVVPGAAMRLDPVSDPLAHDLFRTVVTFGNFECESNGIGTGNHWPPKAIGDTGGFVIHPDYIDAPGSGQTLRPAHQNHVHVQVGPTLQNLERPSRRESLIRTSLTTCRVVEDLGEVFVFEFAGLNDSGSAQLFLGAFRHNPGIGSLLPNSLFDPPVFQSHFEAGRWIESIKYSHREQKPMLVTYNAHGNLTFGQFLLVEVGGIQEAPGSIPQLFEREHREASMVASGETARFEFIDSHQDRFVFELSDPIRIAHARRLLAGGGGTAADAEHVGGIIVKSKADYNPDWDYHIDPRTVLFFAIATEVCDASIRFVQENLAGVGGSTLPGSRWCCWSSRLTREIQDRR